jgi:xanthine/uracil permease
MSEHRHVTEPGEMVYASQPSWAPAFFALGALGIVCGTFASGFIFPPYVYGIVGAVIALGAFRSIVRGAIRDYFRLPRRQKARGAALPVATITAPPKP